MSGARRDSPAGPDVTDDGFDALISAWVESQESPNTQLAYRSDLAAFRSWWERHRRRPPITATPGDVRRYEQMCIATGASEATVSRRLSALSSFFTFAVRAGAVRASPVRTSRPTPIAAAPTGDLDRRQVAALIRSSADLGDRASVLVALLLVDGLRLGEVLAADIEDVTFDADRARIAVVRRGAAGDVVLDRRTSALLRSYVAGRTDGPLLLGESPTRPAARLTRFGADYVLKRVSARAGVQPAVSANTLRRSFVARAFADGSSVESIRDRLGHADVRTTCRHLTAPPT